MEMADTDKDGKINIAEFQKLRTVLKVNEKLKADLGVVGYGRKAPTSLDELAQHEWRSTKSTSTSDGMASSNKKLRQRSRSTQMALLRMLKKKTSMSTTI
jgi:hypothetical protein